ncbi:transmembrane and coiled-coil domains protein, putative, partial [Ixodes scapularis]
TPDLQKTRAAIEHVSQKIARTRELIKAEQTTRDDNVNEYLKLAANADRQQMQRIKNVFEKKNQKSAQTIAQLQKKLENYIKRKRDLETHGASSSWQPRDVLQNVGQGISTTFTAASPLFGSGVVGNIKGGLSGLASVAHSSTDSSLTSESSQMASHQGSTTGAGGVGPTASPRHPPLGGGGGAGLAGGSAVMGGSSAEPLLLGAASSSSGLGPSLVVAGAVAGGGALASDADIEPLLVELNERKDECQRLAEEIEALKNQMHHECSYFSQALQEERYRYERLEEQMNDLIELHQNEIENLKQGIADMEEKVQYQSEERLRDVQELLESCQTRISRMEHQQHQHLQQLVSLDALDNSQARALGLKLVNVLLMLLQLVLLLISTVANIVMPFLQSRYRDLARVRRACM